MLRASCFHVLLGLETPADGGSRVCVVGTVVSGQSLRRSGQQRAADADIAIGVRKPVAG
jgi:hypothetical protein